MSLINLTTPDGEIFVNPEHVVSVEPVRRGWGHSTVRTILNSYVVDEHPDEIALLFNPHIREQL